MAFNESMPTPLTMLLTLGLGIGCGDDGSSVVSATESSSGTESSSSTGSSSSSESSTEGSSSESVGSTTSVELCGNGVLDVDEECDGRALSEATCLTEGFVAGDLLCADDCRLDTSACLVSVCGNETVEGEEECDGAFEDTCLTLEFDDGVLSCSETCTFDTTECVLFSCGNDLLEGKEVCDGGQLAGASCQSVGGFIAGDLLCNGKCTGFDTTQCLESVCGDVQVHGTEACDGLALLGQTCVSLGFLGGVLGCNDSCTGFDTSGCLTQICGTDTIEGTELCDGPDLGGQSCLSLGFAGGTLRCDPTCSAFDTSTCVDIRACVTPNLPIGPNANTVTTNSITVPPEAGFVSDANVYVRGTHTAVGDLEFNVRHAPTAFIHRLADNICGANDDFDATFDQDGLVTPDCQNPIAIEGVVLPTQNLDAFIGVPLGAGVQWDLVITDTLNANAGSLQEWCIELQVTPTDPGNQCGNGLANFNEDCDGADLHGASCTTLGFLSGTLGCTPGCDFDTSACLASICNDGVISGAEQCDGPRLNLNTCEDLGFNGGSLDCNAGNCSYDTSECSNNVIAACATVNAAVNNVTPTQASTITIPNVGTVADVDIFVDITHAWVGDVDIVLRHVATNTTVDVFSDLCTSQDNLFTHFNDEGNGLPTCLATPPNVAAVQGNNRSEGLLAALDNLPIAGNWRLEVTDDVPAVDHGVVNAWCIYITPQP